MSAPAFGLLAMVPSLILFTNSLPSYAAESLVVEAPRTTSPIAAEVALAEADRQPGGAAVVEA